MRLARSKLHIKIFKVAFSVNKIDRDNKIIKQIQTMS